MRTASILLSACISMALLPVAAHADTRCTHSAARDSNLDLSGVTMVVFDIGPHRLDVTTDRNGAGSGKTGSIRGKACASDAKRLAELVVSQRREGDRLIVRAERNGLLRRGSWSGNTYSHFALTVTLPDNIAVDLKLGSGDATVDGVVSLSADVGSGNLDVHHIRGMLSAEVDSGNIQATDIGALRLASVGSGDVKVSDVHEDASVGSVNSGGLRIENTVGNIRITSIGSGAASLVNVGGNVNTDRIGSGTLKATDVHGNLSVDRVGSGSVHHRDVIGDIRLPDKK